MKYHLTYGIRSHEIVYTCTIGRREGDLKFNDESVSGIHARFHIENDKLFLTDLGSSNGTFVNGKKIDANVTVEVFHADLIVLGQQNLTIKLEKPEEDVNHTIMESLEDLEKKRTEIMQAALAAQAAANVAPISIQREVEDTHSDEVQPVAHDTPVAHESTHGDSHDEVKVAHKEEAVVEAPAPKKNLLLQEDPGTIVEKLISPSPNYSINDRTHVEDKRDEAARELKYKAQQEKLNSTAQAPAAQNTITKVPPPPKPIEASKAFIKPAAPAPSAFIQDPAATAPTAARLNLNATLPVAQQDATERVSAFKLGQPHPEHSHPPGKKRGLFIGLTLALLMMGTALVLKEKKVGNIAELTSREPAIAEEQTENTSAIIENTPSGDITSTNTNNVSPEPEVKSETKVEPVVPAQSNTVPAAKLEVIAEASAPLVENPVDVELEKIPDAPPPIKKTPLKKKTKPKKELAKKPIEAAPKKTAHKSVPVKSEAPKVEAVKVEVAKVDVSKADSEKEKIVTPEAPKSEVSKTEVSKSEAALLVRLAKLKAEIASSKSARVKAALEADAIDICSVYYKAQKFSINKEWKESRTLASETRGALKKVLLKEISAITAREKAVKAKIPAYLKGQIKTPF